MYTTTLVIWAAFLIVAFYYARRARHPATPLTAAYLLFVTTFSLSAFLIFAVATWLIAAAGRAAALSHPLGAAMLLAIVFVPSFLVARSQLRKAPRQRPATDPDRVVETDAGPEAPRETRV